MEAVKTVVGKVTQFFSSSTRNFSVRLFAPDDDDDDAIGPKYS